MIVTLVGPSNPDKGGIAQHTTALAERLAGAGHTVDLVSWSAQYPRWLYPGQLHLADPATEPAFPGVRRDLRWNSPPSWWRAARTPAATSDLVVVCVVNALQIPAYETIRRRVGRSGRRFVALCHNVVPHDAGRLQTAAIGSHLRRVDHVLVHSDEERERALSLGARSVGVSPLPFHFPAGPRSRPTIDRPRTGRVATFGLVRPYKGVDVLVDALALTRTRIAATIAGEFWTPVAELRAHARRRGVSDRVEIIEGYQEPDRVLDLLERHDLLVLPYRSGTGSQQPRVAHLVGTPVVASRVGSFADQIAHDVDGLLVRPGSAEALAAALDRCYEPGRLERYRAAVVTPDPDAEWRRYVGDLLSAGTGRPASAPPR